jgi:hypothetical protein
VADLTTRIGDVERAQGVPRRQLQGRGLLDDPRRKMKRYRGTQKGQRMAGGPAQTWRRWQRAEDRGAIRGTKEARRVNKWRGGEIRAIGCPDGTHGCQDGNRSCTQPGPSISNGKSWRPKDGGVTLDHSGFSLPLRRPRFNLRQTACPVTIAEFEVADDLAPSAMMMPTMRGGRLPRRLIKMRVRLWVVAEDVARSSLSQ